MSRPPFEITSVDAGSSTAHLVTTPSVNWILLQEGSDLTLIDGGYPGQAGLVEESIRQIGGRGEDIRAALITHGHVDHIGGLVTLQERYGFNVYADPLEVAHVRREYLDQVSPVEIAKMSYQPRVWRWLAEIIPLKALSRTGIDDVAAFDDVAVVDQELDLPGRPVAVASHGHTAGHSGYLLADGQVLASGDALITGHMLSASAGPQLLAACFHHDVDENRSAVEAFTSLDADVVFAGHGPVYRGSASEAARKALAH